MGESATVEASHLSWIADVFIDDRGCIKAVEQPVKAVVRDLCTKVARHELIGPDDVSDQLQHFVNTQLPEPGSIVFIEPGVQVQVPVIIIGELVFAEKIYKTIY